MHASEGKPVLCEGYPDWADPHYSAASFTWMHAYVRVGTGHVYINYRAASIEIHHIMTPQRSGIDGVAPGRVGETVAGPRADSRKTAFFTIYVFWGSSAWCPGSCTFASSVTTIAATYNHVLIKKIT